MIGSYDREKKKKAVKGRAGEMTQQCSCKGPSFESQHPHSGSQAPVTPVPGDMTPSCGLPAHCMHVVTHTSRQNNTFFFLKKKKVPKGENN